MNDDHSNGAPLSPEAADMVEAYFRRVHGAMLLEAANDREDAVGDLRDHVVTQIAATAGTPADVARVLAEFGTPEELAALYADDEVEPAGFETASDEKPTRLAGRILGVPYDVRMPDTTRAASRWWNPLDPRILVPRVFGLGWDINFGAVAVKVHLVRPDDEDEPFAAVPPRMVTASLAVPVILGLALIVAMLAFGPTMPARIPSHFDVFGRADQFADGGVVTSVLLAIALACLALAGWVHARRRPALNKVAATAFATFAGTLTLSQYLQAVYYTRGGEGTGPTFLGLAASFVAPFVLLVILSRVGRAAEQRRDLEKKERRS